MSDQMVTMIKNATNCPVVQVSGRQFPGMVLQGDTLFSFLQRVEEAKLMLKSNNTEEALDVVEELGESLEGFLSFYEAVLQSRKIRLPYEKDSCSAKESS